MRGAHPGEKLVLMFFVGLLLFNPPLLGLFGVPRLVAGVPLLYVYMFVAWITLVALAAMIVENRAAAEVLEGGPAPAAAPAAAAPAAAAPVGASLSSGPSSADRPPGV
jgi:hypothetical protein